MGTRLVRRVLAHERAVWHLGDRGAGRAVPAALGGAAPDRAGRGRLRAGLDGEQIAEVRQTNVDVVLRGPLVFPVRAVRGESVAELGLYADDARRLVSRLPEGPGRPRSADAGENAR